MAQVILRDTLREEAKAKSNKGLGSKPPSRTKKESRKQSKLDPKKLPNGPKTKVPI